MSRSLLWTIVGLALMGWGLGIRWEGMALCGGLALIVWIVRDTGRRS